MTRMVFHIRQHNKWSIFVQYYNNVYHVFGRRFNNENTVFHTTFSGEHTTVCYLDEILKYTRNSPNFSITLFYTDLSIDASFSQYETCLHDKEKEIIGYDGLSLTLGKVLMYLGFIREKISIEEYK
jgi:hypothetical protein